MKTPHRQMLWSDLFPQRNNISNHTKICILGTPLLDFDKKESSWIVPTYLYFGVENNHSLHEKTNFFKVYIQIST